jgi:hypothetical protein
LYFLSVFDARSGALLGQLSDISPEGVSILTETPLQCPGTYLLRILVPQGDQPDYRLEFEAESRWTNIEAGSHNTGFHIPLLTEAQRTQVEKLVHTFSYSKIGEVKVIGEGKATREPAPRPTGLRRLLQGLFTD